jgi:hypothetical protein
MGNPTAPAVKLTIDGQAFSLRFDFESIAVAEETVERPLLTGLKRRDVASPTINLVRGMLYACLLPDRPDITYPEVRQLVTRHNLVSVWGQVLKAWESGLVEPDPDEPKADPTRSQS